MKNLTDIPSYDFENFQNRFTTKVDFPFGGKEAFKIFKIQEVIRHVKFPLPLHRTDYYDILFVSGGSTSSKHCGLKKYEISPPRLFFKAAGQITSGEVYGKDMEGYFCLMEKDFLSNNGGSATPLAIFPFFKYGNTPIISLAEEEVEKFNFLFANIHRLYTSSIENKNVLIASYLNVILQEANGIHKIQSNLIVSNNKSSPEVLTGKLKDLIAEHYLTKQQVKHYAELLFVTPNHLNKVIKQTTGKTASDLISEMRLMDAKVLLKQTNMNVAEIAFYLSFEEASYFSRFFKKHIGLTPIDFRKME